MSALVSLLAFGGVAWMLKDWSGLSRLPADIPPGFDAVNALGNALVSPDAFVLPFEVASVLLLAALIGAVYVAFTRK